MLKALFLIAIGLLFPQLANAKDAKPACLPFLSASNPMQATGYSGSPLVLGQTETTRWAYYKCTNDKGSITVHFVGLKTHATVSALSGRALKIESSDNPYQALIEAWTKFSDLQLNDPRLKPGMDAIAEHLKMNK